MPFKKGDVSYWKGKKFSKEFCQKLSNIHKKLYQGGATVPSRLGQPAWNKGIPNPAIRGENNPAWKGDKVGYSGLHKWIESKLGKAT